MTSDEAEEAFRSLSAAMREHGFDWVANQVEEKLALGKVRPKQIGSRDSDDPSNDGLAVRSVERPGKMSAGSALFAVSEEYTPQERLGVLLDAIELAIPVVNEVAIEALTNLAEFGTDSAVEFEPEADVSEAFALDVATIRARHGANTQLRALLGELRQEISNAN